MTESSTTHSSTQPRKEYLAGEVLVVGIGVAGIQASLDLTRLGFHVTAVEKGSTIGGIMAQLDKTFPTNDCSICILAPKMVEVYRDPNITLYQNTEVKHVEYLADGNIKVILEKRNKGINEDACKNCGECYRTCPIRYEEDLSWFDAGLRTRHAANIPFPSAVPPVYGIEKELCLHVNHGICGQCQLACPANAVTYDFSTREIEIVVGGIVIATGTSQMDPARFPQFLGNHPDVLSGIQFERLMCASGPTGGDIIKLTNKKHAHRIAFLQCVGSRSKKEGELAFCSSVCCMYAMKEAQITKEHDPSVECYIFNTENRSCYKGFHEYYLRAKNEYGVKFMQGRVARVRDTPDTPDLLIEYEDGETGEIKELAVDLVVLETGLVANMKDVSAMLDVPLDKNGFIDLATVDALERKGVLLAGYSIKPMDIPLSVVSGSSVAAKLSRRLHVARFSRVTEKVLPREKRVLPSDEPRIGVLVCHCGINIGRTVDCKRVAEEIKSVPGVVIADHNYYSCSSDSQVLIKQMIEENDLNRFIVASCTPRTHEALFRGTLQEAGLNPYLFELVNIREHVSWVHMNDPEAATAKAIDLIKMNISKARLLTPQQQKKIPVLKAVLVIGGGPAGLIAADNLADQDLDVYIVEKDARLGGAANKISRRFLLDGEAFLLDRVDALARDLPRRPRVRVFTGATVTDVSGFVGNYRIRITHEQGTDEIEVGAAIVATGVSQDPADVKVAKAVSPRIFTQEQFEHLLDAGDLQGISRVAFVQCAGQRHDGGEATTFPNCSGICCKITLKQAIMLHQLDPAVQVHVVQRGMQLSGSVDAEDLLDRVQGFAMVERYSPGVFPAISARDGALRLSFKERNTGESIDLDLDAIVLATPYRSIPDTKDLAVQLKVPVTQDGFMLEAHVKLRPVDFATEGIFVAGSAQWPKSLDDAAMQGTAAAARACGLLAKGFVEVEGITAEVDEAVCIGCGKCHSVCPYSAIEMVETTATIDMDVVALRKARVIEAMCKGCGTCVAQCPSRAIDQKHFKTIQIADMIRELFSEEACCCASGCDACGEGHD